MKAPVTGECHDASRCTIDGRPCWIACLMSGGHMLNSGTPAVYDSISEHNTEAKARAWLTSELTRRGFPASIRNTTTRSEP